MTPDSTLAVTKTCPKDGVHLSGRPLSVYFCTNLAGTLKLEDEGSAGRCWPARGITSDKRTSREAEIQQLRAKIGELVGWMDLLQPGRGQEDGQAVAPTARLAASSVLAPATNSDQWAPVAKHTAAKRSRSALALAAFEVL